MEKYDKSDNKPKYKRHIFAAVNYKEYYDYLSTLETYEIKEKIAYYDSKGQSIITGVATAIIIAIVTAIYGGIFAIIRGIYENPELSSNPDMEIIVNGLITTGIAIGIVFTVIAVISYKNYKNKRYEINIAKDFIADREKKR